MNTNNLHALIDRYEERYYTINDAENNEKFKWKAVQGFQEIWFSEAAQDIPFPQLFDLATKQSSVLINNSMISPTAGIVKMAEARPAEVEDLVRNVLFCPYATIDELQNNMDRFLYEIEAIRQELFPQFYRYKQERHAASCYLAFLNPEKHYIYRYSDAEEFAKHIEFGKDLGSGANFSLANYYEMADLVVEALKEHKTLLEKYDALIKNDPHYYYDESLHLLAFDLMYCCRCYNLYSGLKHASKKESIQAYTLQKLQEKESAERQAKILELEDQIHQIDIKISAYREISLLNVEVTQAKYGKGIVVEQNDEQVVVQFDSVRTSYIIDKKYPMRPRFIDDNSIVAALTHLSALKFERKQLLKKIDLLK